MGHGIAQVFAAAGVDVAVHDPVAGGAGRGARARIAENLEPLGQAPGRRASGSRCAASSREAVAGADWVFEAAPEELELKQEIFRQLDRPSPADAVLATNTSVDPDGEIAARRAPARADHRHALVEPALS